MFKTIKILSFGTVTFFVFTYFHKKTSRDYYYKYDTIFYYTDSKPISGCQLRR